VCIRAHAHADPSSPLPSLNDPSPRSISQSAACCVLFVVLTLLAHGQVMRGYFPLQEILCHNHMSYLCMLESPVFIQIVSNIQYGLKWVNPPHDISVSSECASALYHIVEFRFRGSKKEQQALAALQSHIDTNPQMFGQLLALLLETVVYDDCPNQWALSRPMLGLILTNEVLCVCARARSRMHPVAPHAVPRPSLLATLACCFVC